MSHGHVKGTKREKPHASDWYAAIAAETLRQLALTAAQAETPQPEEFPDAD